MLVKVAGWEDAIKKLYTDLLTVTSERVPLYSYAWLIAALMMIVGLTRGLDQMQEAANVGGGILGMVLAFLSLDGILLLFLFALVIIEVARTIDTYLRDGVFNINIVRFIFTVASMGLIFAGIVEIVDDIFVKDNFNSEDVPVPASELASLINRISDETISGKIAKTVFDALWQGETDSVDAYIDEKGLKQVSDSSDLAPIVTAIIANNTKQVEQYRAGKTKLLGFFVGQVMKETGGKANPKQVNDLVRIQLDTV